MARNANGDRDQVERDIIQKAATDASFRQQLISNPRQTLESNIGAPLPGNVKVQVLEETPSQFYLVLPPAGVKAGSQLSDEELGAVAGGTAESWNQDSCVGTLRNC